jgi:hypothetical protein
LIGEPGGVGKMIYSIAGYLAAVAITAAPVAQQAMPGSPVSSQTPAGSTVTTTAIVTAPLPPVDMILLKRDTPVHLMVMSEVSTKDRGIGYRFKLRVNQPVTVGGAIIIPVGTLAWGEVTSASSSGNVGKSGTLSAKLLHVDLNGTFVPLTGETQAAGKSGTGEAVMAVMALGVFGLFAKGNNAKIKAGELMTGFTAEDTQLPAPPTVTAVPAAVPVVAVAPAQP